MPTVTITFTTPHRPASSYTACDEWSSYVEKLIARVAKALNVPVQAMLARGKRGPQVSRARQVAALMLRDDAGLTLAEIAHAMGRATPSSAAFWLKRARETLDVERENIEAARAAQDPVAQ